MDDEEFRDLIGALVGMIALTVLIACVAVALPLIFSENLQ